jgi:hypothetical protein
MSDFGRKGSYQVMIVFATRQLGGLDCIDLIWNAVIRRNVHEMGVEGVIRAIPSGVHSKPRANCNAFITKKR